MKIIPFLLLSCLLVTTLAWWEVGHMTVSQIAFERLTALGQTQSQSKFKALVEAFYPFTDGKSNSWAEAAVWADDIKSYGAKFFDDYHFVNMYTMFKAVPMILSFYSKA